MSSISYKQSKALLDRAKKTLASGVSSEFRNYNHPHALFYSHGKGTRIYDVDGNEYLDFTLSQGPLILGHSNPEVLRAVNSYSSEGQIFAGQHIQEIELAEKLNALIPSAEMMRFCLDGSEAVQTAFRVARAVTGKQKFLRFEGHYHGWMDNVCWGISTPSAEALGRRDEPNVFAWSKGLSENSKDDSIILPWNDADLLENVMRKHHHEIAAVITEPVMCNNSCIMPAPGFLERMRALCTEFNAALIFDEVITGFRLTLGGAQKYFGVTPDLSVFAKAMGSGYPISVVAGKRSWIKAIEDGAVIHAGTMNSCNPTVAAALSTISILERDNPYPRMFSLGQRLMEGLRKAAEQAGQAVLIQGPGPMFNIHFTAQKEIRDYRETLQADKQQLNAFIREMHDEKIRIIGRGLWYIGALHTEEEIDYTIQVAAKVFGRL